ncbi:MAG: TatD family hydrolase [Clostridia bacterium]|nr:TatD family hydrolase [Clostridia bacterium]
MIFDTHAHYNSEQFDRDRDEVLSSMPDGGVELIMNACSNLGEIPDIIGLCEKYTFVYGAVGIHPEDVEGLCADYLDKLREYSKHPKIKAIGEIGLDYYWTTETKSEQLRILGEQVDLARELRLPVIIHDREAHADTIRILKEHKVWECGGVFHCYSGSAEMVREIMEELDMYIGFGGALTFKNAKKPRAAAAAVPLDRLLIETDCPYMAPVPYRGKRNSSLYLPEVVKLLAEIKGMTAEEIERVTNENGRRLFSI